MASSEVAVFAIALATISISIIIGILWMMDQLGRSKTPETQKIDKYKEEENEFGVQIESKDPSANSDSPDTLRLKSKSQEDLTSQQESSKTLKTESKLKAATPQEKSLIDKVNIKEAQSSSEKKPIVSPESINSFNKEQNTHISTVQKINPWQIGTVILIIFGGLIIFKGGNINTPQDINETPIEELR